MFLTLKSKFWVFHKNIEIISYTDDSQAFLYSCRTSLNSFQIEQSFHVTILMKLLLMKIFKFFYDGA